MNDNYFIGIYWNTRKESLESCASKINNTFNFLKNVDNSFSEWYKTTKPKKSEILAPLDLSLIGIQTLLIKAQNYNEIGRPIEELGYSFSTKSIKNYRNAHILSFTCGAFVEGISNTVNLHLSNSIENKKLLNFEIANKIYRGLTEIWKPERGLIRSNDLDLLLENTL